MKHLKILAAGLSLALVMSFTACKTSSTNNSESMASSSEEISSEKHSQESSEEISTETSIQESTQESISESSTEETTTQETTTQENTTEAPTTEVPTTEVPTTEVPTTEAPTTEVPTTEAPTTEAPTTEAPIVFKEVNYSAIATSTVRIRTSPQILEDNIYGQLRTGRGCTVIGYHEEWCKVLYQNGTYYIATAYLVEGEEAKTVTYPNGTTNTLPSVTSNGKKVAIDAGHQQAGMPEKEPNAPGSTVMKAKLTTGTQGGTTGIAEYILNLQVSLYLKEELLSRGYEVFMIRENHNCPISNAERAVEANNSGSDIFVRVHANSSTNTAVSGGLTMTPSSANPYVGHMAADCLRLSTLVSNHMNAASGFKNMGVQATDTMTGINWCNIPVTIVEMGFMSNPEEDQKMAQDDVRRALARGIADGIDAYFGF